MKAARRSKKHLDGILPWLSRRRRGRRASVLCNRQVNQVKLLGQHAVV